MKEFVPNPAQERLLRAFAPGAHLLLCSGVGIGKTYGLSFCAARLAWLNPGVNGLIVSHNLNHVRTVIVPLVTNHLKESGLYAGENKQDRLIFLTHGGFLQYGSSDREESLDGKNVGFLVMDEIRHYSKLAHDIALARVREKKAKYPMILACSTPSMGWMYDEYHNDPEKKIIRGSTKENLANLQEGYFERLKKSLSAEMFSQYVEGNWVSSAGSIFAQELGEETFQDLEYYPGEEVLIGMDPGVVNPAVLFAQRLHYCPQHKQRDCLHIIDELVPDQTPLVRLVPMIRELAAKKNYRLNKIYLDPFGGNAREQVYGVTVAEKLDEQGFTTIFDYNPQNTNILNGLEVIRSRMLNADGERKLFISKELQERDGLTSRNVARAIAAYQWVKRRDGSIVKAEPKHDECSHIMDCLRYICVNLFSHHSAVFVD